MTCRLYTMLFVSLFLFTTSQLANAGDKSLAIYTPFTFGTSAIPYNSIATSNRDETIIRQNNSGTKFGIGVNFGFQENAAFFLEKLAVGDTSKDIYLSGIKFVFKDTMASRSGQNGAEPSTTMIARDQHIIGPFAPVSFILGVSRITQDETTPDPSRYLRKTGYNAVMGTELFAMKSSYLHFVPLRFILTLGQNGTSAFATSEIGFSLPGF